MTNSDVNSLELTIKTLKNDIEAQKKTTKNALKCSIFMSIVCFFFVVLNFSILLTIAGGIAGNERKVQTLQSQISNLKTECKCDKK